MLYKYAMGGNAMLLEYCDILNVENQHFDDSNKELSHQVLRLETALETLCHKYKPLLQKSLKFVKIFVT